MRNIILFVFINCVFLLTIQGSEIKNDSLIKDAEAVVVSDIGKSYFVRTNQFFNLVYERTTTIKILSKGGEEYGEVEIPYYSSNSDYQEVYDIEGKTINQFNGKTYTTLIDDNSIFEEKKSENVRVVKIAMPDVKVGSTITYSYKIKSKDRSTVKDWRFQWHIPVLMSSYTIRTIPFINYSWILQGADKFDGYGSRKSEGLEKSIGGVEYREEIQTFTMKNVPAFTVEKFLTTTEDYIMKLDFQLSQVNYPNGSTVKYKTSWDKLIEDYLDHKYFGRYINKCERKASRLLDIDKIRQMPEKEKFDKVISYVKDNFKWNEDVKKYALESANQTLRVKSGSSAQLNLLAVGILREVGIEAYPILISTRLHGKIKYNYPFSHFFNDVILLAKVNNKNILSDATSPLLPNDRIPIRCLNDRGLIVNKEEVKWAHLNSTRPSTRIAQLQINVSDTVVNYRCTNAYKEYAALNKRKKIGSKVDIAAGYLSKGEVKVDKSSIEIENAQNNKEPYVIKHNAKLQAEKINDKIYVKPFINEVIKENPLKAETRRYPLDFKHPKKAVYTAIIQVPENYTIDYLPREIHRKNDLTELNYKAISSGSRIIISFNFYSKYTSYSAEYYKQLKEYFDIIAEKSTEVVVFRKAG